MPDIEVVLKQVEDKPLLMARFAELLVAKGQIERARDLCARAISLAPGNDEVRVLASEIFSHGVPRFYFPMVLDTARHKLYEATFRRVIRPGCRVLDIGSGTGLFAMMAARAGAGEVVTCEANPAVAAAVADVIAKNGLTDRIRVVAKRSSDLTVGIDLAGPVDIVIWDNLANNLVAAGALVSIEQAVRRLTRPGTIFIPARGSIRIALAEDREMQYRLMGNVEGFDLSPFNKLASSHYQMSDDSERFILRSEPKDLFHFDFESGGPFPEARSSVVLSSFGGTVNGIIQWLRLELDEHASYESAPPSYKTAALGPVFHRLAHAKITSAGESITIGGSHNRSTLLLWAEESKHQ